MGRLKEDIDTLADQAYRRGVDGEKIANRLIEAGIRMKIENEGYEPDFSHWNDALAWRCVIGKDGIRLDAFGSQPLRDDDMAMRAAIRFAGEMFDGYARHHMAKVPADADKAQRNVEAAVKMFGVLDEAYSPPETSGDRWDTPVLPESSPVQADSGLQATGSARKLLSDLHIAEIGGDATLGVKVHVEDQPIMATLVELGFLNRDDVSDRVTVTTKGKDTIGVRPDGVPDLPVDAEPAAFNVGDSELAARYVDLKIRGVEKWIAMNAGAAAKHDYEVMARVLTEVAYEIRAGLHLPEDKARSLQHGEALRVFFADVHGRNVEAGWWTDLETRQPKLRNLGEMLMLFVTEICEAYDAYVGGAPDDKLPHHPGLGVELADLGIRWADVCGALAAGRITSWSGATNPGESMFQEVCDVARRYEAIRKTPEAVGEPERGEPLAPMDVAVMTEDKLVFNASRADHKIENRLKDDGKKT